MTTISSLSPEHLTLVFDQMATFWGNERRPALSAAALVCKAWVPHAQSRLFADLHLETGRQAVE